MVLKRGFENAIVLRRPMAVTTARNWGKLKNGIPVERILVKIRRQVSLNFSSCLACKIERIE